MPRCPTRRRPPPAAARLRHLRHRVQPPHGAAPLRDGRDAARARRYQHFQRDRSRGGRSRARGLP
eukprot:2100187-Prymnesium_polylepis.1